MGFGFARVQIKGIRISEGLLYYVRLRKFFFLFLLNQPPPHVFVGVGGGLHRGGHGTVGIESREYFQVLLIYFCTGLLDKILDVCEQLRFFIGLIYLSICLFIYLSVCLSYLSIYLPYVF